MQFRGLHIFEIGPCATSGQPAGTAPAINYQAAPGTGANAIVSGNIDTTGNANALIVGASISDDAGLYAGTSPLTFNDRSGWGSGFNSRAEDALLATGGVTYVAFTANTGTDNFQTGVMAFKAVTSGSASRLLQSVPHKVRVDHHQEALQFRQVSLLRRAPHYHLQHQCLRR